MTRTELCEAVLQGVGNADLEYALRFGDEFERLSTLRDTINMICNRMREEAYQRRNEARAAITRPAESKRR